MKQQTPPLALPVGVSACSYLYGLQIVQFWLPVCSCTIWV